MTSANVQMFITHTPSFYSRPSTWCSLSVGGLHLAAAMTNSLYERACTVAVAEAETAAEVQLHRHCISLFGK